MARRFSGYAGDPVRVARALLGQRLVRVIRGRRLAGVIAETEAYLGPRDRAAHTFGGRRTPRNASMWRGGGHAYVYLVYGLHHCLNVVCGAEDEGVAVLLRALEPTEGLEAMRRRRPAARRDTDLCSGPGRLTQALGIDRRLDGVDLCRDSRLFVEAIRSRPLPASKIRVSSRIGVAYAREWADAPLRFCLAGSPHLSAGDGGGRGARHEPTR